MQFERLFIFRRGDTPTGSIEFSNELGEVKLTLDDQLAQDVLQVCADALVRVSKKAADEMTCKVLDGLGLELPSPDTKDTQ